MHCVADFCLVPMGVDSVGVTKYIAECQRVLQRSGLSYQLHGYGTGVQGEYGAVMKVIEECHEAVHAMGCPRIATDIRIGTRTDKQGSLEAKVASVTELLAKDKEAEEGSTATTVTEKGETKEPELPTVDGPLA